MLKKADQSEKEFSIFYHSRYKALLISSYTLRKYQCAQVDIAFVGHKSITIVEVKSSEIGLKVLYRGKQIKRLKKSCYFVQQVTKMPCFFKAVAKNIDC